MSYEYSPNTLYESPTTISVTDQSANPQMVITYTYGTDTTTVTRKHPSDSSLDQSTEYSFFTRNNKKTHLWKVEDPYGKASTSCTYVPTGTDTTGKTVDVDYKISDDPDLVGKVFKVVDPLGNATDYRFNDTTGTVASVTYADGSTQTYTYYDDLQGNPTDYVKTLKNVRGNYFHFVRSASTFHRVDAIKISAPVNGQEPTNWGAIAAAEEFDYYPDNDPYGQKGLVWRERVPHIDGSEPEETVFRYWETVNGHSVLRSGPTVTEHRYWDGSIYTTKCSTDSYDDMGNVSCTTDANGRTTSYTYDAQGLYRTRSSGHGFALCRC